MPGTFEEFSFCTPLCQKCKMIIPNLASDDKSNIVASIAYVHLITIIIIIVNINIINICDKVAICSNL